MYECPVRKLYIKSIGNVTKNTIAKIQFGFIFSPSIKLPLIKSNVDLVTPHPGQGI